MGSFANELETLQSIRILGNEFRAWVNLNFYMLALNSYPASIIAISAFVDGKLRTSTNRIKPFRQQTLAVRFNLCQEANAIRGGKNQKRC